MFCKVIDYVRYHFLTVFVIWTLIMSQKHK